MLRRLPFFILFLFIFDSKVFAKKNETHYLGLKDLIGFIEKIPGYMSAADGCRTKVSDFLKNIRCDYRKKYFTERLNAPLSIEQTFQSSLADDPAILLWGESHVDHQSIEKYPEYLDIVKKLNPKLDCLLLESKDYYQSEIDQYTSGRADYEDTIQRANTAVQGSWPLAMARKPLLEKAQKLGLRVIATDTFSDSMQVRNEHMAAKVQKLIEEKSCNFAVMIVGARHIYEKTETSNKVQSVPLPPLLRKVGVKTASIRMISSYDSTWRDRTCEWNPVLPVRPLGFMNGSLSPEIQASPFKFMLPEYWSDYTATIVFPSNESRKEYVENR